jgi:hypothetical protein
MVLVSIAVAALPLEFQTLVNASRTSSLAGLTLASVVVLGTAAAPVAAQNYAPPAGAVIDLSAIGGPIPNKPTLYTSAPFSINEADVVGGSVTITFAFRNDSFGLLEFWGADLFDVNTPDQNLLANGNFNKADSAQKAPDWNYAAPADGSGFPSSSFSTGCGTGHCWADATAGGYDELSQQVQSVVLNKQDQYRISFFVSDPAAQSNWTWSQYSTNGSSDFVANGADVVAYAGPVGSFTQAPPLPCSGSQPLWQPLT